MAISRMQQPRQQYGLGSIVKGIKKAVSGVAKGAKNILKSDAGKLGLLALGGMIPFGATNTSLFGRIGQMGLPSMFSGAVEGYKNLEGPKKFLAQAGIGTALSGGLAALMSEDEETREMASQDVGALRKYLSSYYSNLGYNVDEIAENVARDTSEYGYADGGRIGYAGGTEFEEYLKGREEFNKKQNAEQLYKEFLENKRRQKVAEQKTMAANGGRIGFARGPDNPEQNAIQAAGIMNLPLNQNPAGVTELDLRETGGFIPPVGVKEKADDIPAMLANNEFVFTADAVRGMGDGDVNKGAQRMYDMMKKLEKGGRV